MILFSANGAMRGKMGSLVKAKSNRYFPKTVTTMTRGSLTHLLITNLRAKLDIDFLITFAPIFLDL